MKLNKKYNLANTILLQYDAMLDDRFIKLINEEKNNKTEIGVWIEIVQPLVEKVGLKWRGRAGYVWDWHVNPGFLMSYTLEEKKPRILNEILKRIYLKILTCHAFISPWSYF